jgi:hypothetical protein
VPAPLGPLVGFALGVLLAAALPGGSPTQGGRGLLRPEAIVALFAALVYAPVCAYFIAFAGDWSLAYLLDSRAVPSAVLLILVLADAASVLAGFSVGRRFTQRRSLRAAAALAAAPLGAALLFVVILYGRLRLDGTFHQVRGDFGIQPVAGGPLGYALLWMNALLAAGFGWSVQLLRDRRQLRPKAPPNAPMNARGLHAGDPRGAPKPRGP